MPKIRVGVVKGGRGFAAKKFKPPKPVPAKFKGERVAPVNHDSPGGTYHGKHTVASVRKRIADPNKPIAPAGPGPRGMTYSRYKQETGGSFKDYHKNVVNNPARRAASDAHDKKLKNDPGYHKTLANVYNEDRRTRLQDAKDDYKESGWSSVKSTKTNPKPKKQPGDIKTAETHAAEAQFASCAAPNERAGAHRPRPQGAGRVEQAETQDPLQRLRLRGAKIMDIPAHLQGKANRLQRLGAPRASSHPNTARVSAQNLSLMAKRLGRCGDINEITGYVCVTQPHDEDVEHMAVQIGGPNDGKVYSTWGGRKVRE